MLYSTSHGSKLGGELPVKAPVIQCAQKVDAPMWRREHPPLFAYRLRSVCFSGENYHRLMGSGGKGVVAVFVSELFLTGTMGRDICRRFRDGALGAFLEAG